MEALLLAEAVRPDAVLETASRALQSTAYDAAITDASAGLGPMSPSPTPGELKLRAEGSLHVVNLDRAQAAEAARPQRKSGRVVPFEWAVLALAGFVEAIALRLPVETILNLSSKSWEGQLIAGAIALFAAVLADRFAEHMVASRPAHGRARDHELGLAGLFATMSVVIGAAAVCSRIYAASLDTGIESGVSLDPSGVMFFIGFQLTFVAVNLGLATSLERRVTSAQLDELKDLEATQASTAKRVALQRNEMDAIRRKAVVHYRNTLAKHHVDGPAKKSWEARTTRETTSSVLFTQVFPDIPPEPGAETTSATATEDPVRVQPPADSEPEGRNGAVSADPGSPHAPGPATGDREPNVGAVDGNGSGSGPRIAGEDANAVPYPTDEDLIAAILG